MSGRVDDELVTRDEHASGPLVEPPPPSFCPPRISRFTVLRIIGTGGMGVVYSAYDDELGRKVAIKVLQASRSHETLGRSRVLREAQALARLAHPNVVRIYEVGEFDHQLYLAMEFLQGDTLRDWQTVRPRGWREVLAVYLQAGRGLAAAHAAGIVHRDFKPDNVIVGDDGFIRVLDFGVARSDESAEPAPTEVPGRGEDSFDEALTLAGTLIGTPAYMSLEQLRGRPANALSDQFSFCVALYEGLYGSRPFRGAHLAELQRSVALGRIEDPPRGARTPPWLRRVILRGLDNEPTRRWPSMQALLTALERDPGRRWRQWAVSTALVAVASGMTLAATQDPPRALCKDAAGQLAEVWDDARRETLLTSFRATGLAYAPTVADHVVRQLDSYAGQWIEAHTEACEATAIHGEQSEALLDMRMACLRQRRAEMRTLVDLLNAGDPRVIERAAQAAANLRSLATCNEGAALATRLPVPESPAAAADIAAAREQLAAARAHQVVGSHDKGLALAAEALRRAQDLGYRPLVAEALQRTGELQHNAGAFATAEATLLEAYFTAEGLRHDEVQLAAAVRLAYLVGVHQARHDQGLLWSRHAQALIGRGGAAIEDQVVALHSVGMIRAQQGDAQAARVLLERSLALTREHNGPDDPQAATILIDLGNLDNDRGEHEQAQPRYEEAYAVIEATLGPDHPLAVKALNNLGNALRGQGRYREAREHLDRALALAGRVLPPGHPSTAIVMSSLGEMLADEGRNAEAESFLARARPELAAAFGADHPHVAAVLTTLGDVRRRQGKRTEARADLERALVVAEMLGADHPELAAPLSAWGDLLLAEGELAGAAEAFTRALAIVEKANGPAHRHAVRPLVGLGEVALAESRPEAALASLERALALTASSRVAPGLTARVQFGLARARWEVRAARPEAVALAREASYVLRAAGEGHAQERVTIERWIASR